ncbi:MAG: ABC transporter ATP-binding protein [Nocardiopsaceae bacterium]|nr:ABC transporter ATP-binding protein [Nocardiopsaceae bacterium]
MYQLTGVTKRYRTNHGVVAALQDVDLNILEGEFLAVQGPTGGGKTTLLQILGGIDVATSGAVLFGGQDLSRLRDAQLTRLRRRWLAFVFQTFNLIPTLNAQENVEIALAPLRMRRGERRERAEQALVQVGLGDRRSHLPAELSGGQQQRVAIARALVKRPKVILADEPTGNLDEGMRDEIIALIEQLWQERGITVILVTHDSFIAGRAPRVAWISKGRLTIRTGESRTPSRDMAPHC